MRLAFVWKNHGALTYFDERDYDAIARSLLTGHGYAVHLGEPTAFRPPGQPLFLTLVYAIFGFQPMAAEIVASLILCIVPFAVASLVNDWSEAKWPAGVAAFLGATHPALAYASASLYPVAVTTVGLVGGAALLAKAVATERRPALTGRGQWGAAMGGAALLGVAATASPYLAPLPVLAGIGLLMSRQRLLALCVVVAGLLPTGLWVTRNALVVGSPTLGTHAGYNLALGANDRATPTSGNWIEPDPVQLPAHSTEVQKSEAFSAEAKEWIAEHPGKWVGLAVLRVVAMFDSVGNSRMRGEKGSLVVSLAGWSLTPWVILGVIGIITERKRFVAWLTAGALALVLFSAAITIAKPRFRFPVDPLLAVTGALALERAIATRRKRA